MKTFFAGKRSAHQRKLVAFGVAALFAFSSALAQPAVQQELRVSINEGQGSLPVFAIGTLESREGETKLEFLRRVGRVLDQYTKATTLEACGVIAERTAVEETAQGKWTVPLVTQQSHIACAAVLALPSGTRYTGETIHSHPEFPERTYRANEADALFLPITSGQHVRAGRRVVAPSSRTGETFSSKDFSAGPGWLVDHGQLYYQNGKRTVVSHGPVFDEAFQVAANPDSLPEPYLPGVRRGSVGIIDLVAIGGFQALPSPASPSPGPAIAASGM